MCIRKVRLRANIVLDDGYAAGLSVRRPCPSPCRRADWILYLLHPTRRLPCYVDRYSRWPSWRRWRCGCRPLRRLARAAAAAPAARAASATASASRTKAAPAPRTARAIAAHSASRSSAAGCLRPASPLSLRRASRSSAVGKPGCHFGQQFVAIGSTQKPGSPHPRAVR